MNISGVEIGPDQPCRIIAEASNAHNGDLSRAHRIIEAAKKAGADFLKLQCFTVPELCQLRGVAEDEAVTVEPWTHMTMGELYGQAETPHSWFPSLIRVCGEVGIPWFSSVFGPDSFDLLERFDCPAYKFAALDVERIGTVRHKARLTGKPVIQSYPAPPHEAIPDGVLALWCPPGYPQLIPTFSKHAFGGWADGLSYHGTDVSVPIHAAKSGAKLIEVHVQLDDEPSELEPNVSLTMTQLAELCEAVRPEVAPDVRGKVTGKFVDDAIRSATAAGKRAEVGKKRGKAA